MIRKSLCFEVQPLQVYMQDMLIFPLGNFSVGIALLCVDTILICCGLLWFRMPGSYSATRKEENARATGWFVPQFGYGTEGEWFHETACEINYTSEEYILFLV